MAYLLARTGLPEPCVQYDGRFHARDQARLSLLGLACHSPLDDPQLGTLERENLESCRPELVERLPQQVVALQADRKDIPDALHGANGQHGAAHVLQEEEMCP